MAKEKYSSPKFQRKTLELIGKLNEVIEYFKSIDVYPLTLRQLYYQAVSRGYIPNNDAEYKKITTAICDARMAGLIDWNAIEDRTRYTRSLNHWNDPSEIVYSAAKQYANDKRFTQPIYVEAWIEKDALIGILEPIANKYDVPCFSCRGYVSISTLKDAADRFKAQAHREGRIIIYAGDHDPSGIDIPRAIGESLRTFGADVQIKRIGLTMEQVKKYNPPRNPAKLTDKRAAGYVKQYGSSSWELDALDPQVLTQLFSSEIEALTNSDLFHEAEQHEAAEKSMLYSVYQNWHRVVANL